MCDIVKSTNTQGFFHKICLGKLAFHKTIRKKRLVYSYQEKLTYTKPAVIFQRFFISHFKHCEFVKKNKNKNKALLYYNQT